MIGLEGWALYLWDQACDVLMLMDEQPHEEKKKQSGFTSFGEYG